MRVEKRLLSLLLCLAIVAAGCGLAALAEVEAVSYIDHSWNGATNTLTSTSGTTTNYTVLTGSETRLTTGWYVARGTLTYEGRLTVSGDVYLILANGCKVIAKQGITVPANGSLKIHAQSEGKNMGTLEAEGANNNAAIGGLERSDACEGGPVEIHGGGIRVNTHSGGAGIGGGRFGTGTVTVYGGSVDATAGNGAGLGGGQYCTGEVTVYGGEVKATAGDGAGIGGGYLGDGTVTVYGGSVDATAGDGAGIGGGFDGAGTVTVYGGRVEASTSQGGAAIGGGGLGGGGDSGAGTVTIYGGSVEASTTFLGAAIGGGEGATGTVTVYGGHVKASADNDSAAIGGGFDGAGTVIVNGGSVTASTSGGGAAIGGGFLGAGTVTVNGGHVYAVHTTRPEIAVRAHVITLSWTEAADFVCASGYDLVEDAQSNEGGRLTLAKSFRSADSGTQYAARDWSSSDLAGKLLIPDTDDAATLHFWPAKADFTLPADLTRVGANAFEGIAATTVEVPAGVTTVGANAFSDSGLQKIRFLGEHTIVDATAFADCGSITAFAIPGTDTWMSLEGIPNITLLPMT